MATTRRVHRAPAAVQTGSPVAMTRISNRFDEHEREARFLQEQLPLQRRTSVAALIVATGLVLAQWPLSAGVGDGQLPVGSSVILGATVAAVAVLAVLLSLERSARWTRSFLIATTVVLPAAVAVVFIWGADVGAQPMLLIVAGVLAAYFTSRWDLFTSIMGAGVYSAITIPAWLIWGDEAVVQNTVYTLTAAGLAHVVGIAEARRVHRELRTSFAQREDLRRLSAIDVLTGLANRRAFDERLAVVWRTWMATGRAPTVLMMDIDHFKRLNDTLGHQAGDIALRMVADSIRNSLRKGSDHQVSRYGGEEFVVLLPNEEHHVAHAIADRIVTSVRTAGIEHAVVPRGSGIDSYDAPLTISVGIATARATMSTPQDLVDAADRALYRAKGDGRDRVRCEEDEPAQIAPLR